MCGHVRAVECVLIRASHATDAPLPPYHVEHQAKSLAGRGQACWHFGSKERTQHQPQVHRRNLTEIPRSRVRSTPQTYASMVACLACVRERPIDQLSSQARQASHGGILLVEPLADRLDLAIEVRFTQQIVQLLSKACSYTPHPSTQAREADPLPGGGRFC